MSGTYTNGNGNGRRPFTLFDLQVARETMDRLKAETSAAEAVLKDSMRRAGFDPDLGCLLFVPESERKNHPFPPRFVRFSAAVKTMCLVNPNVLEIQS